MENRKDIGKAINDKLNSLDKMPREEVWTGINEELQKNKKKRRTAFFFFWGKTLGILLLGSMAAFYFYNQSNLNSLKNSNETIIINDANKNDVVNGSNNANDTEATNDTNSDENSSETGTNKNSSVDGKNVTDDGNSLTNGNSAGKRNTADLENSSNNNSRKNAVNLKGKSNERVNSKLKKKNHSKITSKSGKSKSKKFLKAKTKKSKKKSAKKEKLLLTQTNVTKKDTTVLDLSSLQGKNTSDLLSEIKSKKKDSLIAKKKKEPKINLEPKDSLSKDSAKVYHKFYVDVFVSPTLNGYFSNGSTLDSRLDSLPKKSEIKFSYGIGLTYDLSDKISVRIGFHKTNMSYVTKNAAIVVNAGSAGNYNGISYNPNISNQTIYSESNGSQRMDITQKISYTEIPLEVKYKFLDKKIGLKSSFGFSYLYLNDNVVIIKTENGYSQEIGKTKDLSDTSLSVNLGLEMDYPLFKDMKIFVEPMFNYQIKAFSNSSFKPYVFGIHTGIRYCFNNK
ncbi:MAG: hypothetical protein ABIQ27_01855 [Flavobacterium sp.]|uniref:hypothetical protein n=1 Tax=Flavobacterium sp. TaxID=239 RepID=UPI0032642A43